MGDCHGCGLNNGAHMSDCPVVHNALRGQTFELPGWGLGVNHERAAVVKYLRKRAGYAMQSEIAAVLNDEAKAIERGEQHNG